jgi:hypothetical protein
MAKSQDALAIKFKVVNGSHRRLLGADSDSHARDTS